MIRALTSAAKLPVRHPSSTITARWVLATEASSGAFYRAWRLVAVDGTTFDLPDTAANAGFFGRPGSPRGAGKGAFPQVRVTALGECGTHAIFAAALGALAVHETELARRLFGRLRAGMLLIADRGFTGFGLWRAAAATGAPAAGGLAGVGAAAEVAPAVGLLNWHRRHRFCANCGAPSDAREAGHVRVCPVCGTQHHPRTDPVVIMLVTAGDNPDRLHHEAAFAAVRQG